MSDFDKLKNIAERNGDIHAATLGDNLKRASLGKDGWGEVVIAVDNKTIGRIMKGEMAGALYVTSQLEWKKESEVK